MVSTLAQIETLKEQVANLGSNLAEIEKQARRAKDNLQSAKRKSFYLTAAQSLRKPSEHYSLWNLGVLIVGPAASIMLVFMLLTILGLPSGFTLWIAALVALVTAILLAGMLNLPATAALPKLIADQCILTDQFQDELDRLNGEVNILQQKIALAQTTIQELRQADALKREELLKRKWKAMRDEEWDAYIIEVFAALGAQAEPMPDKENGIDLLVRYGAMMIAVEAQGFVGSVGIEVIKQAVAGRLHYGCDRAAVITNSRFAAPARAYAASNQCFLIGEQEFPAFVLGSNLELFK